MTKNFLHVEDVLADESFLAWYHKESAGDISAWEKWLRGEPQYQSMVNEAVLFMDNLTIAQAGVSPQETEAQLTQLHNRIRVETTPVVPIRSSPRRWWIGAAAAVLIICAGLFLWKNTGSTRTESSVASNYGERSTKELPDGSTMILNANSNVRLSKGWEEGQDREVWLDGEAYFQVRKTKEKSRFIVHTDQLDVIVTGTQFNVNHRDNKTTVLLTEGSVTIRTCDGKEVNMKPGDYVEMLDNNIERKTAKEENVLAWKDNKIAFDNTPINEVAKLISNHYGIKVNIKDEAVKQDSLTGIMSNTNLDDLLRAIELVADVKIEKIDNEINISSIQK